MNMRRSVLLVALCAALLALSEAAPRTFSFKLRKPYFDFSTKLPAGVTLAHGMDSLVLGDVLLLRFENAALVPEMANNLGAVFYAEEIPRLLGKRSLPSDPLFRDQWHLHNTANPKNDMDVVELWDQGYDGKGVTVAVVDDGLYHAHNDIKDNYNQYGSYNFNGGDGDPEPRNNNDKHGTRIAGQIVASRDNGVCGVGLAHGARVSGIRLIADVVTDTTEARALTHALGENHIYSNSWGPTDSGIGADAPGRHTQNAFEQGTSAGRDGKGAVYVFAAGNGHASGDNCNYDGYANSPYTIAVGAVSSTGAISAYSEGCGALTGVAYSSAGDGKSITTIDYVVGKPNVCASDHGGTSAAAPQVSAVVALILQKRDDLTWRDVQHILARGAAPPVGSNAYTQGVVNSAGLWTHPRWGFGVIRAAKPFNLASTWTTVGGSEYAHVWRSGSQEGGELPVNREATFSVEMPEGADGWSELVEHVLFTVTLTHPSRGNLAFYAKSPSNTVIELAARRLYDTSSAGLDKWTFTTPFFLDEPATGKWTLSIVNHFGVAGKLTEFEVTVRGRFVEPQLNNDNLAGIIVGSVIGGLALIGGATAGVALYRNKKTSPQDPTDPDDEMLATEEGRAQTESPIGGRDDELASSFQNTEVNDGGMGLTAAAPQEAPQPSTLAIGQLIDEGN